MAMDGGTFDLSAQERKLTVDALMTYGLSLAGLIQSDRFPATSPERAQLLTVLLRTTMLLKRLGGTVPAEMQLPPASEATSRPIH
jgi:hypothetical protein